MAEGFGPAFDWLGSGKARGLAGWLAGCLVLGLGSSRLSGLRRLGCARVVSSVRRSPLHSRALPRACFSLASVSVAPSWRCEVCSCLNVVRSLSERV